MLCFNRINYGSLIWLHLICTTSIKGLSDIWKVLYPFRSKIAEKYFLKCRSEPVWIIDFEFETSFRHFLWNKFSWRFRWIKYTQRSHAFCCLQMNNKLEPWSLAYILRQQQNTLIFTQLTDSNFKMQGHSVCGHVFFFTYLYLLTCWQSVLGTSNSCFMSSARSPE